MSTNQQCQYSGHETYGSGDATKVTQWRHERCLRLVQYPICDGCYAAIAASPRIRCKGCRTVVPVADHFTTVGVL